MKSVKLECHVSWIDIVRFLSYMYVKQALRNVFQYPDCADDIYEEYFDGGRRSNSRLILISLTNFKN